MTAPTTKVSDYSPLGGMVLALTGVSCVNEMMMLNLFINFQRSTAVDRDGNFCIEIFRPDFQNQVL